MAQRRPINVATVSTTIEPSASELAEARRAMLARAAQDGYSRISKVRHIGSATREDMPGAFAHHFTAVAS